MIEYLGKGRAVRSSDGAADGDVQEPAEVAANEAFVQGRFENLSNPVHSLTPSAARRNRVRFPVHTRTAAVAAARALGLID